jgi:hypothetical protein
MLIDDRCYSKSGQKARLNGRANMADLALSAMAALFELTHYRAPRSMANCAKQSYSGGSYLGWRYRHGRAASNANHPPLVGVITYYIVRRAWERDESGPSRGTNSA